MSTALCIVDIIAESQYVLTEFIGILKCNFHLNPVCLSFQINRIMKASDCGSGHGYSQRYPPAHDTQYLLRDLSLLDPQNDGQLRIQISSLMKTALYICLQKILSSQKSPDPEGNSYRFRSSLVFPISGAVRLPVQWSGFLSHNGHDVHIHHD